jgi:hypothetical protein
LALVAGAATHSQPAARRHRRGGQRRRHRHSELQAEIDLVLPELQARGTAIPSRDVLEKQVLER